MELFTLPGLTLQLVKRFLLLILGVILWGGGCKPDLQVPQYEVDGLVPLLRSRLGVNDLLRDSTIVVDEQGLMRLVTRERLATIKPGEVARPLNDTFYNSASIQSLELNKQVIQRDITLGQLARGAGPTGQLILLSHGNSLVVPPVNGIGPNDFNVDATQFFSSMTLRDGWLVLRLENNLPLDLANLQYEIANRGVGGTVLLQNNLPSLAVGAVHYDSVRLQNNIQISGQLVARLTNVDVPGSNGNPVPIDTNDAIGVTVTVDKLDPVAATAVFPSQNLIEDTAVSQIVAPSARLTKVHVSGGNLFLNATSTVQDVLELDYVVPGGVRNGSILQFTEVLPPAPPGGTSQRQTQVSIQGYEIDMTSLPRLPNAVNEFYAVFRGRVDSSGQLVTLTLEDSVSIITGTQNLRADRGYGFIGYDTIQFQEKNFIEEPLDAIISSDLQLNQVQVALEILNYIGAPIRIDLHEIYTQRERNQVPLQWDDINRELQLPPAQETSPGLRPQPGRLVVKLDSSNSNAQDLVEIRPDSIFTDLTAFLNKGVDTTELSQFLYTAFGVETFLSLEVPLDLRIDQFLASDTSRFTYGDLDSKERLQGGELRLLADNFYPLAMHVDILLLDGQFQPLDTLLAPRSIAPAQVDTSGRASKSSSSEINYALGASQLAKLRQAQHLVLLTEFQSPANRPAGVRIYSDNYLDLQLVGDLKISTQ